MSVQIVYDYVDDGSDPTLGESNFGLVYRNSSEDPIHRPGHLTKPAFQAALTLQRLVGWRNFLQRQPVSMVTPSKVTANDVYVLSFGAALDNTSAVVPKSITDYASAHGLVYNGTLAFVVWLARRSGTDPISIEFSGGHSSQSACLQACSMLGQAMPSVCFDSSGKARVTASGSPIYLFSNRSGSGRL